MHNFDVINHASCEMMKINNEEYSKNFDKCVVRSTYLEIYPKITFYENSVFHLKSCDIPIGSSNEFAPLPKLEIQYKVGRNVLIRS